MDQHRASCKGDGSDGYCPELLTKLTARLSKGGSQPELCYEAGPCGYGLHRLLTGCGYDCVVVAPSLRSKRAIG
jgi:transposase